MLHTRLEAGELREQWILVYGPLTFQCRLFVPATFSLFPLILAVAHDDNQRTLY